MPGTGGELAQHLLEKYDIKAGVEISEIGDGLADSLLELHLRLPAEQFPRQTDIGLTLHRLSEVLDGDLDELTTALRLADQEEQMESNEG